jgi:hypothetical protein
MEIHVTDDRLGGYFRRYQLAIRMMSHGARTQTVCQWSGLTPDQMTTQRRRWGFDPEERRRGPAPSAFHVFFKTRRHQSEATLFASLCRIVGATTGRTGKKAALRLPTLENGELLCEALEAFQEWEPDSELDFEHAVQLATGVVQAEDVTLWECSDCHGALLIEGSRRRYANCGHCRPAEPAQTSPPLPRQQSNERVVEDREHSKPERNPDHVPEGEGCSHPGDLESDRDEDAKEKEPAADDLDHGSEQRDDC